MSLYNIKNIEPRNISIRLKSSGLLESKCFFVVPSSLFPSAVVRNKIKRRARVVFRKHPELIKKNTLISVYFKKGAEKLKFSELEKEIIEILKK